MATLCLPQLTPNCSYGPQLTIHAYFGWTQLTINLIMLASIDHSLTYVGLNEPLMNYVGLN